MLLSHSRSMLAGGTQRTGPADIVGEGDRGVLALPSSCLQSGSDRASVLKYSVSLLASSISFSIGSLVKARDRSSGMRLIAILGKRSKMGLSIPISKRKLHNGSRIPYFHKHNQPV